MKKKAMCIPIEILLMNHIFDYKYVFLLIALHIIQLCSYREHWASSVISPHPSILITIHKNLEDPDKDTYIA